MNNGSTGALALAAMQRAKNWNRAGKRLPVPPAGFLFLPDAIEKIGARLIPEWVPGGPSLALRNYPSMPPWEEVQENMRLARYFAARSMLAGLRMVEPQTSLVEQSEDRQDWDHLRSILADGRHEWMVVKAMTRKAMDFLATNAAASRIAFLARPIGGGAPVPGKPDWWQLDDPCERIWACGLNPRAPWNMSCIPTHHLFASEADIDRLLPAPIDDESDATYRTGMAGRPGAADFVIREHARRIKSGEVISTISQEARHLSDWLSAAHPSAVSMKAQSVENAIRPQHQAYKAALNQSSADGRAH